MLSFVISENIDSYLGFQLAGVSGVYSKDKVEIERVFKKTIKEKDIGIIFLTENAYQMIETLVIETKRRNLYPLILVIPDRHGYRQASGIISKYIEASVGL